MKKMLLAAAAGFVVAFAVGFVSTPTAEAQSTGPSCKTAQDCVAYGQSVCPGDPVVCTTKRYCVCA